MNILLNYKFCNTTGDLTIRSIYPTDQNRKERIDCASHPPFLISGGIINKYKEGDQELWHLATADLRAVRCYD